MIFEDNNDNDCKVLLKEIVMILPYPVKEHRSRQIFNGLIKLKNWDLNIINPLMLFHKKNI